MTSERTAFLSRFNVSRETEERLSIYADLLMRWNSKINLVSRSTLPSVWRRHFHDSAQIVEMVGKGTCSWADLGSGGGFPGAIAAILAAEAKPAIQFHLIEADRRKAAFLATVSRETDIPFEVVAKRIEDLPGLEADVISARALAPLTKLLGYADLHMNRSGKAIFLKGTSARTEVKEALDSWRFNCETHRSETDDHAVILEIGNIERV